MLSSLIPYALRAGKLESLTGIYLAKAEQGNCFTMSTETVKRVLLGIDFVPFSHISVLCDGDFAV